MLRSINGLMLFYHHLGSLNAFEQGALLFHFAPGTPNDIAGHVLALDMELVGQVCVQSVSLQFCSLGGPWTGL